MEIVAMVVTFLVCLISEWPVWLGRRTPAEGLAKEPSIGRIPVQVEQVSTRSAQRAA